MFSYFYAYGEDSEKKKIPCILQKSWIAKIDEVKVGNPLISFYSIDAKTERYLEFNPSNYSREFNPVEDGIYRFVLQKKCGKIKIK